MRACVYVDGFNLYHGCLEDSRHKWLDLRAFCELAIPEYTVDHIHYFTAPVKGTAEDPNKPRRQHLYIRALGTLPNVTVHQGHFQESTREMYLARPLPGKPPTVMVKKWEEKETDVGLAVQLVTDAFDGKFEAAVIVSNDTDLLPAIKLIRHRFGKSLGVLNPSKNINRSIQIEATFYRPVTRSQLEVSQFPETVVDAQGRIITKPKVW